MSSFKIGIFGLNSNSGVSFTKNWKAKTKEITKTIKLIDEFKEI